MAKLSEFNSANRAFPLEHTRNIGIAAHIDAGRDALRVADHDLGPAPVKVSASRRANAERLGEAIRHALRVVPRHGLGSVHVQHPDLRGGSRRDADAG